MGDPICKWRNATVETTVELVAELPKKVMSEEDFRDYMADSIYGKAFTRTAYHIACQLALYYIDDDKMYYPRFTHNISKDEAVVYLHHWIKHYYVPNPYTARRFDHMDYSVKLMYAIANHVNEYPDLANLENACDSIFGETTGNLLNVKFILNEYSNILEIDKQNNIKLIDNQHIEDYVVWHKRNDKKAFFDEFNK